MRRIPRIEYRIGLGSETTGAFKRDIRALDKLAVV